MSQEEHGTILILGENPFQPSPEIVSLKYFPSLCQVQSLDPEAVIINLHHKPKTEIDHLLHLCEEINSTYGEGLPIFGIYEDHHQIDAQKFVKTWQVDVVNQKQMLDDLTHFLYHDRSQKQILQTLETLENFKKSVHRELEMASIFQEALFNQSLKKTNLEFNYHYYFSKGISGHFVRFFPLSASHTGYFIGDVKGQGTLAGLMTGFILGQFHAIEQHSSHLLWQPHLLLEYLSQALHEHNSSSEFFVKGRYGILDLTNGEVTFADAGLHNPLLLDQETLQILLLEPQRPGFPLGMFPHLTYQVNKMKLPIPCRILSYSDVLVDNSHDWLKECLYETHDQSPRNLLAKVDTHFTDVLNQNEDRLIMVLELKPANQTYINVRQLENSESDIFETSDHQIPLTIDQIVRPLTEAYDRETLEDLQLGLEELLSSSTRQVQNSRVMHPEQTQPKGFQLTWWVHPNRIDISIKLDQGAVPWSYSPEQKVLDLAVSLMLFFDNIQVNASGLEISMTKILTV
ncbi:MAG: PP2C family protein-serine/threonine phosphatase [Candidatus Caenarcaniphilales bacterium]|nr:PP2C family protein-serine/threonine phosphatase [Candidatus Caenarcaniphilales bacterium]